jgi:hypothetical protein
MKAAGDEFLAGSGLSSDENVSRNIGHPEDRPS